MADQPESQHFMRLRTMTSEEFFRVPIDFSVRGAEGRSLLHVAIAHKKLDIAAQLIERSHPLDTRDANGQTPLHYAALLGQGDFVKLLLKKGAAADLPDKHGNGPLWHIVMIPKMPFAERSVLVNDFLERGANPQRENRYGRTPYQMAETQGMASLFTNCQGRAV
jgi:ankyrin repeat protein